MLHDKNFVITSDRSWSDSDMGDAQHMAMEMSRYNKVLYVNPPQDIIQLMKGSVDSEFRSNLLKGSNMAIKRINHSLWIMEPPVVIAPVNKISYDSVFDILNKKNNRKLSRAIHWAMNELNFNEVIHINDNDVFGSFYLKELLMPKLSVYYKISGRRRFNYIEDQINRLEKILVRKSDIIITNSDAYAVKFREQNLNSFSIGQGVDFSGNYIDYSINNKLRSIPGPIIGYTGNLDIKHMSPDLIFKLAVSRPDYSIVLIGTEDHIFKRHSIHMLPNVFFIREDRADKYLSYATYFDVCIYPVAVNNITNKQYHSKIDEYLYIGKPVVACDMPAMNNFYGHVYLAGDSNNFINLVDIALREDVNVQVLDARIEFAKSHSWENCVEKIHYLIDIILRKSYPGDRFDIYEESMVYS
ncbi:MAG: hypothetical protein LUF90_01505 [Rikenellaceae bacterium]|nr:hypothetical protein [Rikenellaceae bacterium]